MLLNYYYLPKLLRLLLLEVMVVLPLAIDANEIKTHIFATRYFSSLRLMVRDSYMRKYNNHHITPKF